MSLLLPINHVLISVFNKSKILDFIQKLSRYNIQLLSTTNTAKYLSKYNIPIHKISDYTKFPEIMNGRMKTLHHKIYAGILCRPNLDELILQKYNIQPINMIIVDFYPFYNIMQHTNASHEELLEYIDIGGPNMVRAAIKNYKNVITITDSSDYNLILKEMDQYKGSISIKTSLTLASKALKKIIKYDTNIVNYFDHKILKFPNQSINNSQPSQLNTTINQNFPKIIECMNLKFTKMKNISYGENPHQKAALYKEIQTQQMNGSVISAQQLQGKKLSYNNIIDLDTALECVKLFKQPTCVIVKHANPCGVATSDTIIEAYKKAYQSDPTSAFGGIIAFNQNLDVITTKTIIEQQFVEAIIAPNIQKDCLHILSKKNNIRVLSSGLWNTQQKPNIELKRINGGLLIQEQNIETLPKYSKIVTISEPTPIEMQDLLFCWKIVKFVKSNAIVCAKNLQTIGIGSGQMNRINAVKIATTLINPKNISFLKGAVMASDAFFPFPDGIQIASTMGIRCIIQPGGSIKDLEVIKTANQHKIAMIFTYTRHFRH